MAVRIRFPYIPPKNRRQLIHDQLESGGASAWIISRGSCVHEEPEFRAFAIKFLTQQTQVRDIVPQEDEEFVWRGQEMALPSI